MAGAKVSTTLDLEKSMKNIIDDVLGMKQPSCRREYHVMVSRHSHPLNHAGDAGFYMLADDILQARLRAEELYPRSQYTIVQVKPIR